MIGTISEIINDMERGVFDFTVNGECSGCGQCCSNILPLSTKEIKEIRRYIKKHHIAEHKRLMPTVTPLLDMTCPFLMDWKEKDKCAIYPVRPHICRCFICSQPPSKVRENKELFWRTRKACNMRETFLGRG